MNEPAIVVLSDRSAFREGVVPFLQSQGFGHVIEYDSGAELVRDLEGRAPRLVLIDLEHGAEQPFSLLQEIRRQAPGCTALILGTNLPSEGASADGGSSLKPLTIDPQVLTAMANLAMMSEGADASEEARQRLCSALTPRQREVLGYLATGSDNLKIAANLGISERAVKAHVSALLSLFGVENRTELAVLACRAGLRPPLRSQTTAPTPMAQRRTA